MFGHNEDGTVFSWQKPSIYSKQKGRRIRLKHVKLITDSAGDINKDLCGKFTRVPLAIRVGDREFVDDEELDLKELLRAMKESTEAPKTASPSPWDFLREYTGEDCVFVVTISSQLSGSYANAVLAAEMARKKKLTRFVHVFDSKNATVGQTLVTLKVLELIEEKRAETEIVEEVNDYIENLNTYGFLESIDNLVKSGRVSKMMARLGSALNIRLVFGRSPEGTIDLVEKVRGTKRAMQKLVDLIAETGSNLEKKICGIAHINCFEKAQQLYDKIRERFNFKDVIIFDGSGITTVYGNEGGLVIAF
ncbi:MAG TPA: DegV family protein [Firmicutes bacterium]|jgi:DegV family protein with EDD domain|nr:DegV family protein [Bacillota bacterium]